MKTNRWENKAKVLYANTKWLNAAISAGKLIDNRLHHGGKETGRKISAPSSSFDMHQYLAFFDYDVLKRRGLTDRIISSTCID